MGKRYIYNWKQAYYFMVEGKIEPIEKPQIHHITNKIFFVFSYDETIQINNRWILQKNNK